MKAEARRGAAKGDGESEALAAIAALQPADRAMAERLHALIKETAPLLAPKTWYGMPAYAKDGCRVDVAGAHLETLSELHRAVGHDNQS